ncbi:hypothetical protein [Lonomia obliqua multiple nucleopolyhedrovirus]|uniref:Uncharacterized protein n=1 Tax=Lonomia obliqua multiple nucleopolyhedrovirus TaxID=134394 RepID=A0A126FCB6_9ABAC|nr:hypothetical protein [Lonomia obliqua multiple nucleopolyhedrovirus]AKN81044.1 hypothetical protein [Lonomia obliqua multiple nucleopolyhedrovirus]
MANAFFAHSSNNCVADYTTFDVRKYLKVNLLGYNSKPLILHRYSFLFGSLQNKTDLWNEKLHYLLSKLKFSPFPMITIKMVILNASKFTFKCKYIVYEIVWSEHEQFKVGSKHKCVVAKYHRRKNTSVQMYMTDNYASYLHNNIIKNHRSVFGRQHFNADTLPYLYVKQKTDSATLDGKIFSIYVNIIKFI